jgi:hypothetical protein
MTGGLRDKLASLRDLAPRLNATVDQASEVVRHVDEYLEGLGLGVSAMAPPFDDRPTPPPSGPEEGVEPRVSSHLAYGRLNGSFRIHVVERTGRKDSRGDREAEADRPVAWSSCPREAKLRAFATLPDLLDEIATSAQRLVAVADSTAVTVGEILASLSPLSARPRPARRHRENSP